MSNYEELLVMGEKMIALYDEMALVMGKFLDLCGDFHKLASRMRAEELAAVAAADTPQAAAPLGAPGGKPVERELELF